MKHTHRKTLKIIALILALALLVGLGIFANSLVGNPISKALAKRSVNSYLLEHYADTDFEVSSFGYNFKSPGYCAHISSPSSPDSTFSIDTDMRGRVRYDDYDTYVSSGWNTWRRIEEAYRKLTDSVLEDPSFPYELDIGYGSILTTGSQDSPDQALFSLPTVPTLDKSTLVLDQDYDIREMGSRYGQLVLYVNDETVTEARAAEILLDIRRIMDEASIPFYSAAFTLEYPRPLDSDQPRREESVHLLTFLYEDIYEEGMTERVAACHQATLDYYSAMDAQKQEQQAIDTDQ